MATLDQIDGQYIVRYGNEIIPCGSFAAAKLVLNEYKPPYKIVSVSTSSVPANTVSDACSSDSEVQTLDDDAVSETSSVESIDNVPDNDTAVVDSDDEDPDENDNTKLTATVVASKKSTKSKKEYPKDKYYIDVKLYESNVFRSDNSTQALQKGVANYLKAIPELPAETANINDGIFDMLAFNLAREILIRDLRNDIADALTPENISSVMKRRREKKVRFLDSDQESKEESNDESKKPSKSSSKAVAKAAKAAKIAAKFADPHYNDTLKIFVQVKKRDQDGNKIKDAPYDHYNLNSKNILVTTPDNHIHRFNAAQLFYGQIPSNKLAEFKKGDKSAFMYRNLKTFEFNKTCSPFAQLQREVNIMSNGKLVLYDLADTNNPMSLKLVLSNRHIPPFSTWHTYNTRLYAKDNPSYDSDIFQYLIKNNYIEVFHKKFVPYSNENYQSDETAVSQSPHSSKNSSKNSYAKKSPAVNLNKHKPFAKNMDEPTNDSNDSDDSLPSKIDHKISK